VLLTLTAAALSALALSQDLDTTVQVARGDRLDISSHSGEVNIQTWSRSAVRVVADPSSRGRVQVFNVGSVVTIRTEGRRGPPPSVDLEITAPAWMRLDLSGVYTDVKVAGLQSPISIETVQGDVDVSGGQGNISLQSVEGSVSLRNAKGRIEAHSVNQDVIIANASGEINVETVNGDISLDHVDATSLEASTVNGDVQYDGPIHNGGRYSLTTHNGDIGLAVPQGTNASVSVSTFNGDFKSDFEVSVTQTHKGRRLNFNLGNGSAQVTLESFQGTIHLARPGKLDRSEQ
jgi:Putative adhesin